MKTKLLFICLFFFVECCVLSPAGYAEESQVVVSATGRVLVKPDMAEFDVVVKSDANTAETAVAETAEVPRPLPYGTPFASQTAEMPA